MIPDRMLPAHRLPGFPVKLRKLRGAIPRQETARTPCNGTYLQKSQKNLLSRFNPVTPLKLKALNWQSALLTVEILVPARLTMGPAHSAVRPTSWVARPVAMTVSRSPTGHFRSSALLPKVAFSLGPPQVHNGRKLPFAAASVLCKPAWQGIFLLLPDLPLSDQVLDTQLGPQTKFLPVRS